MIPFMASISCGIFLFVLWGICLSRNRKFPFILARLSAFLPCSYLSDNSALSSLVCFRTRAFCGELFRYDDYGLAFDLLDMSFAEKIHTYPAYGIHTRGIYHANGFHGGGESADNASYARIAVVFTVHTCIDNDAFIHYAGSRGSQWHNGAYSTLRKLCAFTGCQYRDIISCRIPPDSGNFPGSGMGEYFLG